jgi:hypothetical protein
LTDGDPPGVDAAGNATDVRDMSLRTSAALASVEAEFAAAEWPGGVRLVPEADAAATVGRRMEIRRRLV